MSSIESASADEPQAWFKLDRDGRKLAMGGAWTIGESARLDRELSRAEARRDAAISPSTPARSPAWTAPAPGCLLRTRRALESAGAKVSAFTVPALYQPLLKTLDQERKVERSRSRIPAAFAAASTASAVPSCRLMARAVSMLGYLGRVTVETAEAIAKPKHKFRVAAMFHQVEETGINALADCGPARLPDRRRAGLSGRGSVQALRRGGFHHQSSGRGRAARDRRADHRHHRGGPFGLGLHRPDRHHARQ